MDFPDDVEADHDGEHQHREVLRQRRRGDRVDPEQRRDPRGEEPGLAGRAEALFLLRRGLSAAGPWVAAAGAAETWTGGGGQVFSPSRTTVTERCTTSSKSMRS